MAESVTVWYLEQTDPGQLQQVADPGGIDIREARVKQFRANRFLYELVGAAWEWVDKLSWSDQQWRDYAERENLRTWIATVDGSPAGYFELEKRFFSAMRELLKDELGVKSLVIGTADHNDSICGYPHIEANMQLDFIDGHG